MKSVSALCALTLALSSCGSTTPGVPVVVKPPPSSQKYSKGANPSGDLSKLAVQANFLGAGEVALPQSIDLSANLPGVGNQGGYGTCVGWANGYYLKTYLDAKDKNLTTFALNTSNTFSPSYLFKSIPDDKKGDKCDGTTAEAALEAMKTDGIATLSASPYLTGAEGQPGECDTNTLTSSEKSAASSHKIDRYFRINPISTQSIKSELAAGRPVSIGIAVGKSFQDYSGGVISSDTEDGGHAMLLVGYDDSKGANGAFKGVNSWGSDWGESGFYWIDYNYAVQSIKARGNAAFVAYNAKGAEPVNPPPSTQDKPNLALYTPNVAYTYTSEALKLTWDLVNAGGKAIPNTAKYYLYFVYVNDYDASDYVLDTTLEFGRTDQKANTFNNLGGGDYAMNVALSAGATLAEKVFGSADSNVETTLGVPDRTLGLYRLWVIASKNLDESNYDDNYLYSDEPLIVKNGQFRGKTGGGSRSFKLAPLHASANSNYRYEDLVPLFDHIKTLAKAQLRARATNQAPQHGLSSILK